MRIIALIPARSGSQRIKDKNIKDFFGKPLMAYTIELALNCGIFDDVYVSSDSKEYLDIAKSYGAKPIWRQPELAKSESADIDWIKSAIKKQGIEYDDLLFILRPTNPFRTNRMLIKALLEYKEPNYNVNSLRAVEPCKQHPYKMWRKRGSQIDPAFHNSSHHTMPTQELDKYYVQNASLEIIPVATIENYDNVSGPTILGYKTEGYEGFDINTEDDWILAEELVKRGKVKLG